MQKFIGGLLIVLMCGVAEMSFAAAGLPPIANDAATGMTFLGKGKKKRNKAGKRTKNGRYKKRRGLFGKKSDCGCPKN